MEMDLFNKKLILAPMSGITESIFRNLCKKNGADIVISEMVSADGIYYNTKNTKSLLFFKESERPIGIQLFGANARHIVYAAKYLKDYIQPDFIDLNCGCPVPKVVKKNGGSALLKNTPLFTDIISQMTKAVSIPITIKIRSGWIKNKWVDIKFAKIAEDCGAAAITLHPRSKTMGFSEHSFWERIGFLKKAVNIPVIGNGDIVTPEDGYNMFSETGCDSIMIGRAVRGNPWIFSQIKEILKGKKAVPISTEEKHKTIQLHLNEYVHHYGNLRAVKEMKKHIAWYITGQPGAASFRDKIFKAESVSILENIINQAFKSET